MIFLLYQKSSAWVVCRRSLKLKQKPMYGLNFFRKYVNFFGTLFLMLNDRISLLSNRGIRAPRILNFMNSLNISIEYPLSPFTEEPSIGRDWKQNNAHIFSNKKGSMRGAMFHLWAFFFENNSNYMSFHLRADSNFSKKISILFCRRRKWIWPAAGCDSPREKGAAHCGWWLSNESTLSAHITPTKSCRIRLINKI